MRAAHEKGLLGRPPLELVHLAQPLHLLLELLVRVRQLPVPHELEAANPASVLLQRPCIRQRGPWRGPRVGAGTAPSQSPAAARTLGQFLFLPTQHLGMIVFIPLARIAGALGRWGACDGRGVGG